MSNIKELLKEKTPFAVMQYFERFIGSKTETVKKYELIYINKRKEVAYKLISNEEIKAIKNEKDIKLIIDNSDGKIYEYNYFKEYKESLGIQH
jgi:hypothetical protein